MNVGIEFGILRMLLGEGNPQTPLVALLRKPSTPSFSLREKDSGAGVDFGILRMPLGDAA